MIVAYLFIGREGAYKKALAVIAGACVMVIIGIENIPGLSMIIKKTEYLSQFGDVSSGRSGIWEIELEMFKKHPIFVNGMYSFTYYVNVVSAHNSYIQKMRFGSCRNSDIFISVRVLFCSVYKTAMVVHDVQHHPYRKMV